MSLSIILYNFRVFPPEEDSLFDSSWHREDAAFVEWLNTKNVIFRLIGTPKTFDVFRQILAVSTDEAIETAMAAIEGRVYRELLGGVEGKVFERPKDFAAARAWVVNHKDKYMEDEWDKQRLVHLLDLMEADPNRWLYESW